LRSTNFIQKSGNTTGNRCDLRKKINLLKNMHMYIFLKKKKKTGHVPIVEKLHQSYYRGDMYIKRPYA
jgi:hypothetical protein